MIRPGTIVFATGDFDGGREAAKAWLQEHGLTPDQVRLYVHDGMVMVSAKKSIHIPGKGAYGNVARKK